MSGKPVTLKAGYTSVYFNSHRWLLIGSGELCLEPNRILLSYTFSPHKKLQPIFLKQMVLALLEQRSKFPFWFGQIRYDCQFDIRTGTWHHRFTYVVGEYEPTKINKQLVREGRM